METNWIEVAEAELGRLIGRHAVKKRATVVALVEARLAGLAEERVWEREDTCSRTIYHEKWKRDKVFAEVLGRVTVIALAWRDGRAVRALQEAAGRLAIAAPDAVGTLVDLLKSGNEAIRRIAAVNVLDRAGTLTAPKGFTPTGWGVVMVEELGDEELNEMMNNLLNGGGG